MSADRLIRDLSEHEDLQDLTLRQVRTIVGVAAGANADQALYPEGPVSERLFDSLRVLRKAMQVMVQAAPGDVPVPEWARTLASQALEQTAWVEEVQP